MHVSVDVLDGLSAPEGATASCQFARQKLSAAKSERPVSVSIFDESNYDVRAVEIAGVLEHLTQQPVEFELLLLGPMPGCYLDQHDLVGARNSKAGIQGYHPAGTIFRHKLIAIALRHMECGDDRGVSRVQELPDLGVGSAFDKVESKQRHLVCPFCDFEDQWCEVPTFGGDR